MTYGNNNIVENQNENQVHCKHKPQTEIIFHIQKHHIIKLW